MLLLSRMRTCSKKSTCNIDLRAAGDVQATHRHDSQALLAAWLMYQLMAELTSDFFAGGSFPSARRNLHPPLIVRAEKQVPWNMPFRKAQAENSPDSDPTDIRRPSLMRDWIFTSPLRKRAVSLRHARRTIPANPLSWYTCCRSSLGKESQSMHNS